MENYKEYLEQLNGEYLDTALWMESKMELHHIVLEDKENAMNEIIDILLCAQESGRTVEATIGKSRMKFFLQYKKAILPYQNLKILTTNLMAMLGCMLVMSVMCAILNALDDSKNIFLRHINLWPVLIMSIFIATLGNYSAGVLTMKNYNQTKKVKKRRNYVRFAIQTVIAVILIIPVDVFDLIWSVKLGDITWLFGGLFTIVFLFAVLQESVLFGPATLEAKLIANVQKDYRKKIREKGWDAERYIKSKKYFIRYIHPVIACVLVIEFAFILFLLAGDAINNGTGARLFFFVILFMAVIASYVLIEVVVNNRRILQKLVDSQIQLESE